MSLFSIRQRWLAVRLLGAATAAGIAVAGPVPAVAASAARPASTTRGAPAAADVAPGRLDPSFGTDGVTVTGFPGRAAGAAGLAVYPDGSIVAAGGELSAPASAYLLTRYRCDGTLDTRFGDGGRVVTPGISGGTGAEAVALDHTGRILVVGTARLGTGDTIGFGFARYLPDGRLDPAFGHGGIVLVPVGPAGDSGGSALLIQPDGRIVAAGGGTDANGDADFAAVRLLPDGRLDPSFNNGGTTLVPLPGGDAEAAAVALAPDGRIVIGGTAEANGGTSFALIRLTRAGALDSSFGTAGVVTEDFGSGINGLFDLASYPDGRVLAAGTTRGSANLSEIALLRLRPDGSPDPSFGAGSGRVTTPFPQGGAGALSVVVRDDGRFVVAGQAGTSMALAGYLPDGTLDTGFGSRGWTVTPVGEIAVATGVAVQFGRRLVVSGLTENNTASQASFVVARYGLEPGTLPPPCARCHLRR